MKLLLDTTALIKWHAGTLRPSVAHVVERATVVAVSPVSAWEIAIKRAAGKLRFADTAEHVADQYGFIGLPVTLRHADVVRELPIHHRDPFDRLLIAQALDEGFTILTSDRVFELYRVPLEWI